MSNKKIRLLSYVSQKTRDEIRLRSLVEDVLTECLNKRMIVSFEKINSRLDSKILSTITYKILFTERNYFNLVLSRPISFHPIDGAEVGKGSGLDQVMMVEENYSQDRIRELIIEVINFHHHGKRTEELCYRDIRDLIKSDKDVARIIKRVEFATLNQDRGERIDLLLIGADKKVPLQVKSGKLEQEKHKTKSAVPSLLYETYLLRSGLLKRYVSDIFISYPDIKHY